jgi:hypothetical protein
MERRNPWGIWGGIVLVGLGLVILLGQLLNVNFWGFIWPFFIIAVGAMFFIGMATGGRGAGALAIPGSIIVTIGLILFVQNTFDIWATWAYAWGLIITGVGVGLLIFGSWSSLQDVRRAGRAVVIIGLVLFFTFGILFELGAALLNLRSPGGLFWPVLLILVGLYILVARPLLNRSAGPLGRKEFNFATNGPTDASITAGSDASSTGGSLPAGPLVNAEGGPEPVIFPGGGQVAGVRRVSFRAVGDLTVFQGEREGLEISANQAVLERIRVETRGDRLDIRFDNDWWNWLNPRYWNMDPIRYSLYLREVESLAASGLGNVTAAELSAPRLELEQNGAGNITIRRIKVENLFARQSGLGNIEIEGGHASSQEVRLTGAGNYQARHVECQRARVQLSGLGIVVLWVTEELDAVMSGAGNVEYHGSPRITQRVSGLGNIHKV